MRKVTVAVIALVAALGLVPAGAEAQPPPEATLTGITRLSVGPGHTCFRLTSGQVRCAGYNVEGALGNGGGGEEDLAVLVQNSAGTAGLSGVTQVANGGSHTCAVLTNHQVRCWGWDEYGQLGDGTAGGSSNRPVRVVGVNGTGSLTGVTQIAAGGVSTCARLSSGQARCWGDNGNGQLGNGSTNPSAHPVVVQNPAGTGPLSGIAQVVVGSDGAACARLTSGQARCWGTQYEGTLGNGQATGTRMRPVTVKNPAGTGPLTGVAQLAAGPSRVCAVLESHQARCWGLGPLGNGRATSSNLPVVVRAVSGAGPLTGVTQIAIGGTGSLNGGIEGRGGHTCALVSGGGRQVRCWGKNTAGQLGTGVQGEQLALRPVVVQRPDGNGPLTGATQISSAYRFTCVRLTSGQARCWGQNSNGAQSYGDTGNVVVLPRPVRF
jgi:alpha-tubulin suppressor-like RCC1 family protein